MPIKIFPRPAGPHHSGMGIVLGGGGSHHRGEGRPPRDGCTDRLSPVALALAVTAGAHTMGYDGRIDESISGRMDERTNG
jgi:hypothetical protein